MLMTFHVFIYKSLVVTGILDLKIIQTQVIAFQVLIDTVQGNNRVDYTLYRAYQIDKFLSVSDVI
jgi:hypothetical protein